MINKLTEWFWRLLPDRCEMDDCSRRGVRGNENRIGGKIVCDYCHAKMLQAYYRSILRRDRPMATPGEDLI